MTLTWPRFHIHRSILSLDLFWNPNYSLSQSQPSWNGHELSPFPPDDLRLASSQVALLLPPTSADPWCQGSPAASILPSGVRVSVNLSFFQFPSRVVHADPFNSLIANLFHGQIPNAGLPGLVRKGGPDQVLWWRIGGRAAAEAAAPPSNTSTAVLHWRQGRPSQHGNLNVEDTCAYQICDFMPKFKVFKPSSRSTKYLCRLCTAGAMS